MTDHQFLLKEYAYVFLDPSTGGYDEQNEYYDLQINNNLPLNSQCEFCKKIHQYNCLFDFKDNDISISQALSMIKHIRELELTILWKQHALVDLSSIEVAESEYRKINLDEKNN